MAKQQLSRRQKQRKQSMSNNRKNKNQNKSQKRQQRRTRKNQQHRRMRGGYTILHDETIPSGYDRIICVYYNESKDVNVTITRHKIKTDNETNKNIYIFDDEGYNVKRINISSNDKDKMSFFNKLKETLNSEAGEAQVEAHSTHAQPAEREPYIDNVNNLPPKKLYPINIDRNSS